MSDRPLVGCLLLVALAVALAGATSADLNAAGLTAYAQADYAAAERFFRLAIAQSPDKPLLHYHRAIALTKLARWSEASQEYTTALRLRPSAAVAAAARDALRALAPLAAPPAHDARSPEPAPITLRQFHGGWVTDVVLDERTTATFLVDTGASVCVITPELAVALGIRPGAGPSMTLQTLAGRTSGPLAKISSLRVGEAEANDILAVIHPLDGGLEGILGNSFLARYTVTLDPARGVLDLRER
jgi:clan AA aspartic protease (TIGR02281 family)